MSDASDRRLEDRFDHLHDGGASFGELGRGRRVADHVTCGTCRYWLASGRRCEVWLLEGQPAGGWCNHWEEATRPGSACLGCDD